MAALVPFTMSAMFFISGALIYLAASCQSAVSFARVGPDDDGYDAAAVIVPIELVGGPSCRIIAGMAG